MRKEAIADPTRKAAEALAAAQKPLDNPNVKVPGAPAQTGMTEYGDWTTADEKR